MHALAFEPDSLALQVRGFVNLEVTHLTLTLSKCTVIGTVSDHSLREVPAEYGAC